MRIALEANKHGVEDEDIFHAVRNHMYQALGSGDLAMLIGPARNAALPEVGVLGLDTDDPVVIHADTARDKFLPSRGPHAPNRH